MTNAAHACELWSRMLFDVERKVIMNQNGINTQRFAKLIGITAAAWKLDDEVAERCLEHFTSGGRIVTNVRSWNDRRRSMNGAERRQSWRPSCACREPRQRTNHWSANAGQAAVR